MLQQLHSTIRIIKWHTIHSDGIDSNTIFYSSISAPSRTPVIIIIIIIIITFDNKANQRVMLRDSLA